MSALIADAEQFARRLHDGQLDKSGRPIVEHIARVAAAASRPGDDSAEATAWLYAAVEDAHCSLGALAERFPGRVVTAVDALTHRPGENPDFYLNRVLDDPVAMIVKLAVVEDNLSPSRLQTLDPARRRRIVDKNAYARARLLLHHELATSA